MTNQKKCKACKEEINLDNYYVKVGIFRICYYHGTCWEEREFHKRLDRKGRVWSD